MLNRLIVIASCAIASSALLAVPAHASRIVYLAEEDHVFVPELFVVDLDDPGNSLKLNKDLPAIASGVGSFAISPDGSKIVFSADQHIAPDAEEAVDADLYLVDISAPGRWTRVGGLPAGVVEFFARFSPDGSHLAFTATGGEPGGTQLYLVDLAGPGTAIRMNGQLADGGSVSLTGFRFTPDGSRLVYVAGELDRRFELYAVAVDAPGQSARLNAWGGSVGDSYEGRFRVLPDSRRVVYSAVWQHPGQRELHVVSLDRPGEPSTLNAPFGAGGYLQEFALSPDGEHVAYVADAETDGVFELWLAETGVPGVARRVGGAAQLHAWGLEFTPDGQYLVFIGDGARGTDGQDLFLAPVDGVTDAIRQSAPLPAGEQASRFGVSPAGTQVAYIVVAADGVPRELFAGRTDSPGSAIRINGELTDGAIELYPPPQFSPDGAHVAFIAVESLAAGIPELYAAALDAPGQSIRLNAPLPPGAIVLPVPNAFAFLPPGAPPTGALPEPGTDAQQSDGGGGSIGYGLLLLLGLYAFRSRRHGALLGGVRAAAD